MTTDGLEDPAAMTAVALARLVDHTCLLRPEHFDMDARRQHAAGRPGGDAVALHAAALESFLADTRRLWEAGLQPHAICMYPDDLPRARAVLGLGAGKTGGPVWVAVVGFPQGDAFPPASRALRTREAIEVFGADEIDTVIPYFALRAGNIGFVEDCLAAVVEAARGARRSGGGGGPVRVKVIMEESRLLETVAADPYALIRRACELCEAAGVDFVKTSSGLALPGATIGTVRVMRRHFSRGVKIAGGVSVGNVRQFLAAASEREDGWIRPDPLRLRVGASGLLAGLLAGDGGAGGAGGGRALAY